MQGLALSPGWLGRKRADQQSGARQAEKTVPSHDAFALEA
jgi:hypothetical protein